MCRRLVLALLEVCGQFFRRGKAGARMDRFLTFFQVSRGCPFLQSSCELGQWATYLLRNSTAC